MGKSIIDLSSVTTVGLDLAKQVFQAHGVDALGRVVVAKPIRRNKLLEFFASLPRCLVGLEASGSAHHWARELIKLGHDARMMPPAYAKPYIRRQKNDAADAAAICEAVIRLPPQVSAEARIAMPTQRQTVPVSEGEGPDLAKLAASRLSQGVRAGRKGPRA